MNTDPLSQISARRGTSQIVVKVALPVLAFRWSDKEDAVENHLYCNIGSMDLIKGRASLSKAMGMRTGIFNNAVLVSEAAYG